MANTNATPANQSNFMTDQNFDIDLQQVYSDFIQEIDANRSIVNIQVNTQTLNSFNISTIASLASKLQVGSTAQESRAHCFYRLIGFPVIGSNGQFYNPGLDNIKGTKKLYLKDKITIANSVSSDFKALSLKRENYVNGWLSIFAQQPSTITSSALALSSSTQTRSFSIPTTVTDITSFVADNQKYTPKLDSTVGKFSVRLTDYKDANLNSPDSNILSAPRYHYIQPFMVDPRIDFTVNPASNKVAVPFVPTKKNLLVAENTYVKRPLIEKVIRDRFMNSQDSSISESQQKIVDYILNVPTVKNDSLISQFVNSPYIKSNQASFQRYLYMIQAMCQKLVAAQIDIQTVKSQYYWIPAPSVNGPEGGSDVQGVIIAQNFPSTLITKAYDQPIIDLTLKQAANTFDTSTSNASGTADLGGFAFDGGNKFFDLTFDQDTSTSLGDVVTNQLTSLNKKRDYNLGVANTALQDIEVIMGEWSGLGLCDIIAVMASLYTMDQDKLLGFLDDDALDRAGAAGIDISNAGDISDALKEFVQNVNNYYHLMDDIYQNLRTANGFTPSQ